MPRPEDRHDPVSDFAVDRRTPFHDLAEKEDRAGVREPGAALLAEVENAAGHFADDRLRSPCCCESVVSVLSYLLPHDIKRRNPVGAHGLKAIGRKTLALGCLLKFVSAGLSDLSRCFGGSRAGFGLAMKLLSEQIGLERTDRRRESRESYKARAERIWRERKQAGLGRAGKLPRETKREAQLRRLAKKKSAAPKGTAPMKDFQTAKKGNPSYE